MATQGLTSASSKERRLGKSVLSETSNARRISSGDISATRLRVRWSFRRSIMGPLLVAAETSVLVPRNLKAFHEEKLNLAQIWSGPMIERRKDHLTRKRVAEMSPEEMRRSIMGPLLVAAETSGP